MNRIPDIEDGVPDDLAAEFALGVLEADAQRAAQARAERDAGFAADVDAWNERLGPLLDEIADAQPSPGVWPRIAARLEEPREPTGVARFPPPSSEAAVLRGRLRAWRAAAVGAMAASLALAMGLAWSLSRPAPRPGEPPPMLVGRLKADSAATPSLAAYDPLRRAVLVSLAGPLAPTGKSAQLWLLDAQGKPHSIGLLRSGNVVTLIIPAELAAQMGAGTLAISVEPAGGSPTGLPTGPVVAKGALGPV